LKESEIEREMFKEKASFLKVECLKADSRTKSENAEIRAKLAVTKEKLRNYENMEKDINLAIE